MIVAGIGSRKGVSAAEVRAAIEAALAAHGLELSAVAALATTDFKKDEAGIFEAGRMLGVPVHVVDGAPVPESGAPIPPPLTPPLKGEGDSETPATPSPLRGGVRGGGSLVPTNQLDPTLTRSHLSLSIAGTPSVSESAALAAAGPGARLLGPRIATGRVTCALAESRP